MICIQEFMFQLGQINYEGYIFNCLFIKGEQEVLQVMVFEFDVMLIFIIIIDIQIFCIIYLCKQNEIQNGKFADLN